MRRGDIVGIAGPSGDFSRKPRPALIVQSDIYLQDPPSVTVCLITSHLTGLHLFRVPIEADAETGLLRSSEIEVDKMQAVWTQRVGRPIGRVRDEVMFTVDQAMRRWLQL